MGILPKIKRPASRRMTPLEVVRNVELSSSFRRITLSGAGIHELENAGRDQMIRLFFARDGQAGLQLPTVDNDAWIAQLLLQPKSRRPWVRNYSIRQFRADVAEIDIDFVRHPDGGPASFWAETVEPGAPAGIFDEGVAYLPSGEEDWQLIVGEESAVPAAMSILATAAADLRAEVFLEVPHSDDIPEQVDAPEGAHLHWIVRDDADALPGAAALKRVVESTLPDGRAYTWVAGEQKLPTGLRRHLVGERGFAKSDISFSGYWRHGRSAPG